MGPNNGVAIFTILTYLSNKICSGKSNQWKFLLIKWQKDVQNT